MSLKSMHEQLQDRSAANSESEVVLLRAALDESRQKYNQLGRHMLDRMERMEKQMDALTKSMQQLQASVEASNQQTRIDVKEQIADGAMKAIDPVTRELTDKIKHEQIPALDRAIAKVKNLWIGSFFNAIAALAMIGSFLGLSFMMIRKLNDANNMLQIINDALWQLMHTSP